MSGNWVVRCEARTLDDIRALGGNDPEDERRFATAARVSEINLALYRRFAQPAVQMFANQGAAEWLRRMHPLRLQYELFSDANPFLGAFAGLAEQVRANRSDLAESNPFLAVQENMSRQIVGALDGWRDCVEKLSEQTFLAVYGAPALQAAVGVDPAATGPLRKAVKNPLHRQLLDARIAELSSRIPKGGLREAVIRSLLYAGMSRGAIDERGFEMARRIRHAHGELPLSEFKALVREQFNMLLIDETATLAAIPAMLPPEAEVRATAFGLIKQVLEARGELSSADTKRLAQIAALFGLDEGAAEKATASRSRHRSAS